MTESSTDADDAPETWPIGVADGILARLEHIGLGLAILGVPLLIPTVHPATPAVYPLAVIGGLVATGVLAVAVPVHIHAVHEARTEFWPALSQTTRRIVTAGAALSLVAAGVTAPHIAGLLGGLTAATAGIHAGMALVFSTLLLLTAVAEEPEYDTTTTETSRRPAADGGTRTRDVAPRGAGRGRLRGVPRRRPRRDPEQLDRELDALVDDARYDRTVSADPDEVGGDAAGTRASHTVEDGNVTVCLSAPVNIPTDDILEDVAATLDDLSTECDAEHNPVTTEMTVHGATIPHPETVLDDEAITLAVHGPTPIIERVADHVEYTCLDNVSSEMATAQS